MKKQRHKEDHGNTGDEAAAALAPSHAAGRRGGEEGSRGRGCGRKMGSRKMVVRALREREGESERREWRRKGGEQGAG